MIDDILIEANIKVNGVTKKFIYIEFMRNIKLTLNRYWYQITGVGKGRSHCSGEIEFEGDDYYSLFKKVLKVK